MNIQFIPRRGVARTRRRVGYIGDRQHRDHIGLANITIEYRGIEKSNGTQMLLDYLAKAEEVHKIEKAGRPREITTYEIIGRSPLGAKITLPEKKYTIDTLCDEFDIQTAYVGWHDHVLGDSDFHLLAINSNSEGQAIKGRDDPAMRRKLVAVMDRIHDTINRERLRNGGERIPTVNDVRAERIKDRELETLPKLIIRKSKEEGLTKWAAVRERVPNWVTAAGHEVTRCNEEKSISVLYQGSRKARRHHWTNLERDFLASLTVPPAVMEKVRPALEDSRPSPLSKAEELPSPNLEAVDIPEATPKEFPEKMAPAPIVDQRDGDISEMGELLRSVARENGLLPPSVETSSLHPNIPEKSPEAPAAPPSGPYIPPTVNQLRAKYGKRIQSLMELGHTALQATEIVANEDREDAMARQAHEEFIQVARGIEEEYTTPKALPPPQGPKKTGGARSRPKDDDGDRSF